ncbi:MAG: hypothetical protein ACIAQZ_14715 [Sedimentisphaeraceae bacterium JB056]
MESPELKPYWDSIRQRVERYCDPSDSLYVDPQGVFFTDPEDTGWFGRDVYSWIEPIGFVYQITGDYMIGMHGAAILDAAIDYEPEEGVLASVRSLDMMRAIAFGYDWLSSAMTVGQKQRVQQKARDYIEWTVADNISGRYYHNFMGVGYGGAGLAAIAVKDTYPELYQGWLDVCSERVSFWFENSFDQQGAYCEGHYYMQYGLSNSTPFAAALMRNEGVDLLAGSRLQNASDFLAMIRLPGSKVFEARNDALYSSTLDPALKYLAGYYQDNLLEKLWQDAETTWTSDYHQGGFNPVRLLPQWNIALVPQNPQLEYMKTGEHFTGRGLAIFRSGWETEDVMFSIEAGQFYHAPGGTHNQADKGHFNIYGLGYQWAVDPGYSNSRVPLERGQTVDHSCILVNGEGQAVSGNAIGTNGVITKYEDRFFYAYAVADCEPAYNRDESIVDKALRHALFIRASVTTPAYMVVLDDIYKGVSSNEFNWQMIGAPDTEIVLNGIENGLYQALSTPEASSQFCMDIQIGADMPVSLSSGYYLPLKGTPAQYPKLNAVCSSVNPRFVTVFSPRSIEQPKPSVLITRNVDEVLIEIQWPDSVDSILWNGDDVEFTMGERCLYEIPADFNKDCYVNLGDFSIFANEWLR